MSIFPIDYNVWKIYDYLTIASSTISNIPLSGEHVWNCSLKLMDQSDYENVEMEYSIIKLNFFMNSGHIVSEVTSAAWQNRNGYSNHSWYTVILLNCMIFSQMHKL